MIEDPLIGGQAVDDVGRERMLGGEAIVDRDHDGLGGLGQHRAQGVIGVEVADHAAALMEPHDGIGPAGGAGGVVEPHCELAGRPGDGAEDSVRSGQVGVLAELRHEMRGSSRTGRGIPDIRFLGGDEFHVPAGDAQALGSVLAEGHLLAGDQVDHPVGAYRLVDIRRIEVLVEDHAVLKDLDERGPLVSVGRSKGLRHVLGVDVEGARHEGRAAAECEPERVERPIDRAHGRRLLPGTHG